MSLRKTQAKVPQSLGAPSNGSWLASETVRERHADKVDDLLRDVQGIIGTISSLMPRLRNVETHLQSLRDLGQGIDPAGDEIDRMMKDLAAKGIKAGSGGDGLAAAEARGREYLRRMVAEGELLSADQLAKAWDVPTRALEAAEKRHELFSLRVDGGRYYLSELANLERHLVAAISVSLYPMSAAGKYIFWRRRHGSLAGMTITERLAQGKWFEDVEAVLSMASRYAYEDLRGVALSPPERSQADRSRTTPLLVLGGRKPSTE